MSKKVSVIIPAYNVEKYIEECITSVINQTYSNIEIIVVNDGSTDNTTQICNKCGDKRLKIIEQKNNGVSVARNNGMSRSTGDYILFIDADDILEKNMIETLVHNIEINEADMSICGYKRVFSNNKCINDKIENVEKIFNNKEGIKAFLDGKYFGISLWDKLIKREIAEKVKFIEGKKINEDKFYLFNILIYSKKVYLNNEGLYNYMQRDESVTKSKFDSKNLDVLFFSNEIKKIIDDKYPEFKEMNMDNYIRDHIYIYRNIERNYNKEDYIYKTAIEIKNNLKKYKNNSNKTKKYSKFELMLICNFSKIYQISLKIFDVFIKKRRKI